MYALRRDPTSADTLPAGRPGAAGLPGRRDPGARRRRDPRQGLARARSTSSARRCSAPRWPPRSGCPTRSPRTSRRSCSSRPSPPTGASSGPRSSSTEPYVIAGVNVVAADTTAEAAGAAPGRSRRRPRDRRCSAAARPSPTSRPTSSSPRAPARTSTRCSRYTAVGTPAEVGEYLDGFREAGRRRRADRRPPVAHDRGPAAVGRPHRRGDGGRHRLTRRARIGFRRSGQGVASARG